MPPQYRPVDSKPSFPALEREVLELWRERNVFAQSLERRRGEPQWTFYEGPPFPSAPPGSHHVMARVFKDIFTRYKTMLGFYVERKGGWDCHGLPVELALEAELGFSSKEDIERFGIAEFNARCRAKVLTHVEDFNRLTERIGFWIDLEHAYRTLDPGYIESVWWALQQIHERGLLYETLKVVPYCPRDQVTLSSHELGQPDVYREVEDPSVYVRLPVTDGNDVVQRGDELIVWTTTPWTLASNAAVAADPELTYVRAADQEGRIAVVAEAAVDRVLGPRAQVVARFPGSELLDVAYEPPFDFIPGSAFGPRAHTVLAGDFVSASEGTGLVHSSISFGEEDFRLGEQYGLAPINPVRLDGTFDERIGPYAGRWVKDADADLIEDLRARDRLLRAETLVHSYPHCWRCGTPLLYYAKPSWYIATSNIKERLLAANETVTWYPEHIKHGRFGKWLEGNVDWALSRERYWGTPLPVWRCEKDHVRVVGSLGELKELSGVELTDPHRPYVDDVRFACSECGGEMTRVPEVIDVWFDSGSMPFAQYHAPFENQERFEQRFPADFICEGLDQTRGWFYSLLAISTLLFDRSPYRTVVCHGLLLDDEGRKMSKSRGNVVEPWDVLERFGADAMRWYFFTSRQPWAGYRFSLGTIEESVRQFLLPLWNTYFFYVLYANANSIERHPSARAQPATNLDRWALSRLQATVEIVRERLDDYDATSAGRAIAAFIDELSNWYVRRSRRRFWDGDAGAFATLERCLLTVSALVAPFCPFIADELYDNLDGSLDSVHLADFPVAGERELELEHAMRVARETVRLGLAARAKVRLKVRQPLRAAVVVASGREREAIERLAELVREELNVRELRFVSEADELSTVEVKPNYRALGPRFGAQMPTIAAAVAGLDGAHVAAAVRDGRNVVVAVGGHEHELEPDDIVLAMKPIEGYEIEREGSHAVALELMLDDELRVEGWAREIVHAVQAARRDAGLDITDRIALLLAGDAELVAAAREHERYIAGETLATEVSYNGLAGEASSSVWIDGRELRVAVSRRSAT